MKHMQLAFFMGLISTPAAADINFEDSILSGTIGAFCSRVTVDSVDAPGTAVGRIDLFEGIPEIEWPTPVVPAAPGISFGVKTVTHSDEILNGVIITTTHPPFKNDGTTRQTYVTSLGGSDPSINAYTFDFPWEQVLGTWSFSAEWEGIMLYEVDFEVVHPDLLPQITNGCAGVFLS